MTKETSTVKENAPVTPVKKWYKSAILPWTIIAIVTIFVAGIIVGWFWRSNDMGRITTEATAIVQSLNQK